MWCSAGAIEGLEKGTSQPEVRKAAKPLRSEGAGATPSGDNVDHQGVFMVLQGLGSFLGGEDFWKTLKGTGPLGFGMGKADLLMQVP